MQQRIEAAIANAIRLGQGRGAVPGKLQKALDYAVTPGGARIRPTILTSVAMACGDDRPALTDAAAAALELIHCASLVHDDMPCFDNADVRRGKPSVHRKWSEPIALLTGDSLIVLAFEVIARVAEADDAAWAQAQSRGDRGGYRAYLRAFPDGQYVGEARAALRDLQGDQPSADVEAARRAEAQVAGNSVTRVLIERRLAQLGYNPGQIDGRFVDRTRAALRDFQSTAGVPVTGYVDQRTLVSLLAAR